MLLEDSVLLVHCVSERYRRLTVMRVVSRSKPVACRLIYASVIPEGKLIDHIENLQWVIWLGVLI